MRARVHILHWFLLYILIEVDAEVRGVGHGDVLRIVLFFEHFVGLLVYPRAHFEVGGGAAVLVGLGAPPRRQIVEGQHRSQLAVGVVVVNSGVQFPGVEIEFGVLRTWAEYRRICRRTHL